MMQATYSPDPCPIGVLNNGFLVSSLHPTNPRPGRWPLKTVGLRMGKALLFPLFPLLVALLALLAPIFVIFLST